MADDDEASAKSLRALFDLPRYTLVRVDRWSGWGRLRLTARIRWFRCPVCRGALRDGHRCRWRRLRDLDVARRHIQLDVAVYRVR